MDSAIIQPTQERMRHDPIEPSDRQIVDSRGDIGAPFHAVSTIPMMVRRGSITKHQMQAAWYYMDDFDRAGMVPVRAAQFEIRGHGREEITHRQMRAKERLWNARLSLGMGTPIECAAYEILGMRKHFRQWASEGGFRVSEKTAKRLLIQALEILAKHYGLDGGRA